MMDISSKESEAFSLHDQQDYTAARLLFQELYDTVQDDDVERDRFAFNIATCHANQGNLDEAMRLISSLRGPSNCLLFNKALLEYKCGNFSKANFILDELITNCERVYSDLMFVDEMQLNRGTELDDNLRDSCLIEAINLKAACLYKISGDNQPSRQMLGLCPLKSAQLLDCITLHNQALYGINHRMSIFSYLHQALQQNNHVIPLEIIENIFSKLIESDQVDLATELLHTNQDRLRRESKELLRYLELQLECHSLPGDVGYEKMDILLDHILRSIRSMNTANEPCSVKSKRHTLIELAMSIVNDQCSILWSNNRYKTMEKLLQRVRFIYKPDYDNLWLKNMAHLLFVMDTRFEECSYMYEKFIPKNESPERLHDVDPIVLSNLCVSYVLTGRNGDAEALIKQIEEEQEQDEQTKGEGQLEMEEQEGTHNLFNITTASDKHESQLEPSSWWWWISTGFSPPTHLSIINIAIETLYCLKNNHEFGLTRMFKTIESNEFKLNGQTWFQVKRCILSLMDSHCRQLIYIRDDLLDQIVSFLMRCEKSCSLQGAGGRVRNLKSLSNSTHRASHGIDGDQNNFKCSLTQSEIITFESRYLRSILLAVIHD